MNNQQQDREDPAAYLAEIAASATSPLLAHIRESECIGCAKCIKACPVDAIIGSAKRMHTILKQECIGCQLCVAPCPVDCIDMQRLPAPTYDPDRARARYNARQLRLEKNKTELSQQHKTAKQANHTEITQQTKRRAYIQAAIARVKAKRKTKLPSQGN